jgi:hypothetical protein
MTHSFWWLTCDVLAVYRLTLLIVKDTITEPIRRRLLDFAKVTASTEATAMQMERPLWTNRYGRAYELMTCVWCMSVWVAIVVVLLTKFAPSVWQYPCFGLALAGAAGFLAELR